MADSTPKAIRENFAKTRVALDLLAVLGDDPQRVIIEFNANFPGGQTAARALLLSRLLGLEPFDYDDILRPSWAVAAPMLANVELREPPRIGREEMELFNSLLTESYLFTSLDKERVLALAQLTAAVPGTEQDVNLVYRIWADPTLTPQVYVSRRTIKADAARAAFSAAGQDIVWAVADTGVHPHPHFDLHRNLELGDGLRHWDFTADHANAADAEAEALKDTAGHGTHVAGIIAGETITGEAARNVAQIDVKQLIRKDEAQVASTTLRGAVSEISGVAPRCKILSLKVMTSKADGHASRLIAAIGYIRLLNGQSPEPKIQGLNISLGYPFDPTTFAAGQSPLCRAVDKLVSSGVAVVVAAGNGGYGEVSVTGGFAPAAHASTIADPGNADLAITVGSTHRDMPHRYGVSHFSAKGPTADGRLKPDLVAPGERIISCELPAQAGAPATFKEDTGTSMAAPHVSGAIAAFLSVRREFRGAPLLVKKLFLDNATSLGRQATFEGHGLVDLMRTLQAV
ncbi:S8 family serine peptidase [Phenylobacterium sp.]|uniref:S8 family serine peptidase n=1 Tax=Phenylobacterium sp. TaxID=1871053 RepID=UPI002897B5A9|nr:S8 family serine peptidase [Phenylobacterium sp.]